MDELLFKATHRVSKLDMFKPYLDHRVSEGCTHAAALMVELRALGYHGSEQTVRRHLRPLLAHDHPQQASRGSPPAWSAKSDHSPTCPSTTYTTTPT